MFFIETNINILSSESIKMHFFSSSSSHSMPADDDESWENKQHYSFQISYYLHVIRVKDNPVAQQEYHFAKSLLSQNVVCD